MARRININPEDYTFEPVEVLDITKTEGALRLAALRNLELHDKIEIISELTIESPRAISQDGVPYPATVEKVIEFATISQPINETDTDTDI